MLNTHEMLNLQKRLLRCAEGQDLIEYALIAALLSLTAMAVFTSLGGSLEGIYGKTGAAVASAFDGPGNTSPGDGTEGSGHGSGGNRNSAHGSGSAGDADAAMVSRNGRVAELQSKGLIMAYDCQRHRAQVNLTTWYALDASQKATHTKLMALHCADRGAGTFVSMIDARSGRELAQFGASGFSVR